MKQNTFTGNNYDFYKALKDSISNAESIDVIVSFLMESGVRLIIDDLKKSNVKIRILTTRYLNITQPEALYILKSELKDNLDLRFYSEPNSFHPKAYIFHNKDDSEIYVGSSNISKGALTTSVEWNYHFKKSEKPDDFMHFRNTFEDLFTNHSQIVTDEVLRDYSKSWTRPKLSKPQADERNDEVFEPNPAQLEALYMLNQSREEGYEKALIVAATGIGKTYLAAFDAKNYDRILFMLTEKKSSNRL